MSQDEDLLAEAAQRQRAGLEFAGLIYAHQRSITTARFIDDLHLIALGVSRSEMKNRREFLPLSPDLSGHLLVFKGTGSDSEIGTLNWARDSRSGLAWEFGVKR